MFTLETTRDPDKPRLVASSKPMDEGQFRAAARMLNAVPLQARKTASVAAVRADVPQVIESRWNGRETQNRAEAGDWIVTALDASGSVLRDQDGSLNQYVIRPDTFARLYRPSAGSNEHGAFHEARGTVEALHLPGGFDIVGPWGERQIASDGYLVLNDGQVYGNNAETFAATYTVER